jgi:hypothetical protein
MSKKWLIKVIISFLLSLLVLSVGYKFIVIDRIYSNLDYRLSDNISTVIVGASHLQLGINDSSNQQALNLSNSGMPYYFTYAKSKRLLEQNPQISKLVISLSPIHISPYGDSILFSDKGLSRENSFLFFPLLDEYKSLGNRRYSVDFIAAYLKYNMGVPFNYMEDFKLFLKSFRQNITFKDHSFSGSYKPYNENKIESEKLKHKATLYFGGEEQFSDYSIQTVNRIAELTGKYNVKLYVLNMPIHKEFKKLIPSTYSDQQNKLILKLKKNHNHIKYIDYSNYALLDDDYFDGDHINVSGAEKLLKSIEQDVFDR